MTPRSRGLEPEAQNAPVCPSVSTARWQLDDESATVNFGQQLAALLQPGDVLALIGDLGAGKTRLVQAIAVGCAVPREQVQSPTFTLIHEYAGRLLLRHCDAYRLRRPDEFADLGLDELCGEDGVAIIEWADRVREYLPRDRLELTLTASGPGSRILTAVASGKRSQELIQGLSASWTE